MVAINSGTASEGRLFAATRRWRRVSRSERVLRRHRQRGSGWVVAINSGASAAGGLRRQPRGGGCGVRASAGVLGGGTNSEAAAARLLAAATRNRQRAWAAICLALPRCGLALMTGERFLPPSIGNDAPERAAASLAPAAPVQHAGLRLDPNNPFYTKAAAISKEAKNKEGAARALAKKLEAAAKKATAAEARAQKAAQAARDLAAGGRPPVRPRGQLPAVPDVPRGAPSPLLVTPAAAGTPTSSAVITPASLTAAAPPGTHSLVALGPVSPLNGNTTTVASVSSAAASVAALAAAGSPPGLSPAVLGGSTAAAMCDCTLGRVEKRLMDRMDQIEAGNKKRLVAIGKHVRVVRVDSASTKSQIVSIGTGMTGLRKTANVISTAVSRGAEAMRGVTSALELRFIGGGAAANGSIVSVPASTAGIFDEPRIAPWTRVMMVCVRCSDALLDCVLFVVRGVGRGKGA